MTKSRAADVRHVRLPAIVTDPSLSGEIVVGELQAMCPFEIRRFYLIHGMARGEERGQHAHRKLWQLMCAVAGEVEITFDSGGDRQGFLLDSPDLCLIVPPGLWRNILSRKQGSALMVLASEPYDESDYIRDYEVFLAFRAALQGEDRPADAGR